MQKRGQSWGFVSDTGLGRWVGGGEGAPRTRKNTKEILEGPGRDEEMWMVRARREGSDGGGMKGEK